MKGPMGVTANPLFATHSPPWFKWEGWWRRKGQKSHRDNHTLGEGKALLCELLKICSTWTLAVMIGTTIGVMCWQMRPKSFCKKGLPSESQLISSVHYVGGLLILWGCSVAGGPGSSVQVDEILNSTKFQSSSAINWAASARRLRRLVSKIMTPSMRLNQHRNIFSRIKINPL